MNILTFSGWAQDPHALDGIIPSGMNHTALNYMPQDEKTFFAWLKKEKPSCNVLLGWSLGGQIAVRAVAEKILKPKIIILLAAPFRFEAVAEYKKMAKKFTASPKEMLKDFSTLLMVGDDKKSHCPVYVEALKYADSLQNWLKVLERFDCATLDFIGFPRTLLIHGKKDAVIPRQQSWLFKEVLPNAGLIEIDRCGHAPHLHNPEGCKKLIQLEIERAIAH